MPNINDGRVYEEREIESYLSVEDFIEAVQEAAEGLDRPTVEAEHAYEYGDCSARIIIGGYRPATKAEKAEDKRNREAHAIRQEEMLAAQQRIEKRLGGN